MDMVIVPILLLLLLLVPLAAAQWQSCGDSGTYASNSTYQTNLRLLSSILPKKVVSNTTLFATGTAGHAPDTVYALALCRGDTTDASHCETCVATAFHDAQQLCPYSKDATLYYHAGSSCMLRFSDQDFLSTTVNEKILVLWDAQNISTSAALTRLLLFTLLNATAHSAARSPRRFTTSRLDVGPSRTLYCLMQCTPDLTADDCAACFQAYTQYTLQNGKQGGVVVGTRCSMSYEIFPYFQGEPMLRIGKLASAVPAINSTPGSTSFTMVYPESHAPAAGLPPDAQTTVPKHHGRNSGRRGLWIISVVAPLLSILLCLICSLLWMRRRRKDPLTNKLDQWEDQVALVLIVDTEVNSKDCNEEALLAKRSKKGDKEKDLRLTNHLKRGHGVRDDRACVHDHDPSSTASPDRLPYAPAEPPDISERKQSSTPRSL